MFNDHLYLDADKVDQKGFGYGGGNKTRI